MAASPGLALDTYYSYQISGNFANNQGPNQKGRFVGIAQWNTSTQRWFDWDFRFYSSSNSTTPIQTMTASQTGAGCFASPVARGNAAAGTYAESAVAGNVCDGSNTQSGGSLPPQSFLNIFYYDPGTPYNWTQGSSNLSAPSSYFRIQFQANGPGGTVDAANLQAVAANAQSVGGLGWAAMSTDVTDGACSGNGNFPTVSNNCPYAGNTQNYQGLSGITNLTVVTIPGGNGGIPPDPAEPFVPAVEEEVPAPLPLLGASAALAWSRRLRRRLRTVSTT